MLSLWPWTLTRAGSYALKRQVTGFALSHMCYGKCCLYGETSW